MSTVKNSEVIDHILQTFIVKIARRSSDTFAVETLDRVLKELEPKYDFLQYVKVENTAYAEGMNAVQIMPEIDAVDSGVFYQGVNELIQRTVQRLEHLADFYFIREFQEAIEHIDDLVLKEKDINLGSMQFDYLVTRKQALNIENAEMVEQVIRTLINILSRKSSEQQAVKTVVTTLNNLKEQYACVNYILVSDEPNPEGFYMIETLKNINTVWPGKVAQALQKLIEEIGKSVAWEGEESFIEVLQKELGEEQLKKLKTMGVIFQQIKRILVQQAHEELMKKTLETLVSIVGERTSPGFAVVTLDTVLKNLAGKYTFLTYIKIDKDRYSEGIDAVSVVSDINMVESYKLGQAIREIMKMMHQNLGDKAYDFIGEFKKKLGDEYLYEIENIGINLHFLELEFR